MKKNEVYVGIFLVFGLFCFSFLAVNLGGLSLIAEKKYTIKA